MPRTKKGYTITQLSKKLKRSEQTIWNWINEGKLKGHKEGIKWIIPRSQDDVLEALNENAKRYRNKGWSRRPKVTGDAKVKRGPYRTRTKSNAGRKRNSTTMEVKVPVVLSAFCNDMDFNMNAAIQKNVDEFCCTMLNKIKQLK